MGIERNWLIFEKCGILLFREKEENNVTGKVNRVKNQRSTSSEMGVPNQQAIACSCRISRSTVSKYFKQAEAAELKWPISEEITDNQLYEQLFPGQYN